MEIGVVEGNVVEVWRT